MDAKSVVMIFMNSWNSLPKVTCLPPLHPVAKDDVWKNSPLCRWLVLASILVMTFFVYSGAAGYPLLNFDDVDYFGNYPEITRVSWHNAGLYFTRHYLLVYQPLPVFSFALNHHFTGHEPVAIHMVSLVFHLVNIFLVYILFSRLMQNSNVSLGIAAIFAFHPLNVEPVVWISARSTGMFTCFYLASMLCYLKYLDRRTKPKFLAAAFLVFVLSLLSKPQAITLPAVLLLLDLIRRRNMASIRPWTEKIPFMAMSILFVFISFADKGTMSNVMQWKLFSYTLVDGFLLLTGSVAFYLVKSLLPVSLCSMYLFPVRDGGWLPWYYYAAPAVIALFVYLIWRFRKNRFVVAGSLFFLVTLLPNLPLLSARQVIVADRYLYLPLLGILLFFFGLYQEFMHARPSFRKIAPGIFLLTTLVAVTVFSLMAGERTKVWKNDATLMTDILAKNQERPFMAKFYRKRADFYMRTGQPDKAIGDYSSALRLNCRDIQSYAYRSYAFLKKNEMRKALHDLDQAILLNPHVALFYSNRALVRLHLFDFPGAYSDCLSCMALNPCIPDIYNIIAIIYYQEKNVQGCMKNLEKAIELKPDYAEAYKNRGKVLISLGQKDEAIRDLKKAAMLGDHESEELLKNMEQQLISITL